jgi:chorismate-pyruvate lyase
MPMPDALTAALQREAAREAYGESGSCNFGRVVELMVQDQPLDLARPVAPPSLGPRESRDLAALALSDHQRRDGEASSS